MEEFIDEYHPIEKKYFQLRKRYTGKNAPFIIPRLKKLIKADPDYFESYCFLHELLYYMKNFSECEKIILIGYKRALRRILNKNRQWSQQLRWGWLENRHIICLFENTGIWLWSVKKNGKALNLFRKLLRSNPDDNIGARVYILALRMGMDYYDFEGCFERGGYYDHELFKWFEENYKKFPDEFDWWDKKMNQETKLIKKLIKN